MAFNKIDLGAIKQMYEEVKSKSTPKQDYRWASLPGKGEMIKVRFLPPVGEMKTPFFKVFKHYQLPTAEGETENFTCLKTWRMACPICAVIDKIKTKFGFDIVKDYNANMRAFFNVLVKDSSEYTEGISYIMGFPRTGLVWFLSTYADEDYGDITNPFTGFWVKIMRNNNNQLQFNLVPKPSPIANSEEELNRIAEQCFDLTKIWRNPDDEYIIKANKLAQVLKEQLHQKIGLESSVMIEPKTVKPVTNSIGEPTESVPVQSKPVPMVKPDGAPDCFGQFEEGASRCAICLYEIECQQAKGE